MLADILFPNVRYAPAELLEKYPPRQLPPETAVTRFGPSPTGFMHLGGIYAALISERIAHQSGGVFFLRIEDTDKKREVSGAINIIVDSLAEYDISPDEGETTVGVETGDYGPYQQSQRQDIYTTFVYQLLKEGNAYPCFATPEELEAISKKQAELKIRPGYYGPWALWRERSEEDVLQALNSGASFVIRYRSLGSQDTPIVFEDKIRGRVEMPQNDQDIVILKSGGLPTYHFAHVVDDYLMRTTDVIRGDEWLASVPVHLQLFAALNWTPPSYAHIAPIQKMDGNSRRKLSKRYDPEASVSFYDQEGIPAHSLIEYMLNIADSNFEEWREIHTDANNRDFHLSYANFSRSGALFDMKKLLNISKNVIADMSAETIYASGVAWAKKHDPTLAELMEGNPLYARRALEIEREGEQKRKDMAKWSDLRYEIGYFFDSLYAEMLIDFTSLFASLPVKDIYAAISQYAHLYDDRDDKEEWLHKLRESIGLHGFAESLKTYKKTPTLYRGHIGHVTQVMRVLLTGRNQAPDLWEIMRVMGQSRVLQRLNRLETLELAE